MGLQTSRPITPNPAEDAAIRALYEQLMDSVAWQIGFSKSMPAFAKPHTPHTLHQHPRKCMDIHMTSLRASPTHNAFQHKMAPCRGVPRAELAGARRAYHSSAFP